MANRSGRLGSSWELALLKGLREHGFDVERLHLSGQKDEGDLRVLMGGKPVVLEAKNTAKIDLPQYLRELAEEKANYARARGLDRVDGVVVVKARGKNWKDGFVVQSVRDYFNLED